MEENNLNSLDEVIDIIDVPVEKIVEPIIVQTDIGSKDGQTKCPKCGSTDISLNVNNGHLRCNFCRHEFEPEKIDGLDSDITQLQGKIICSGAQNIVANTEDILTFKCTSCGAEVVIDTNETTQARCHWCRNILSVNCQIPNGSIPDIVLPFTLKKDDAKKEIEKFVKKRKFYAHPKFKEEFTTSNIMGVYFPYMVVDINAHSSFNGQGEHLIRRYSAGSDRDRRTYYDADLYNVEREFDIAIEGLTVESNSDKLNKKASDKTNNIINSIMPFDIENAVKWDANYLRGYSSEKRDTSIDSLDSLVENQSKDIARFAANESLEQYDRGVSWANEDFQIKGQRWKAAYLPVWLYSYQQIKGNKKLLHYVAVNARTKETMGSVPIHIPKLFLISCFLEILGIIAMLFVDYDSDYKLLFLLTGFIYFFLIYRKYRNSNARHNHEVETNKKLENIRQVDEFVKKEKGLTSSKIDNVNNKIVSGKNLDDEFLNTLFTKTDISSFFKKNK